MLTFLLEHAEVFAYFDEGGDTLVEVFALVAGSGNAWDASVKSHKIWDEEW